MNQVVLSPDSVLTVPAATDRRVVAYGTMPDFNTVQFTNAPCNIAALTVGARGNCNLTPTPFNAIWTRNSLSALVSASATTIVSSGPPTASPMMMVVPMNMPSGSTLQTQLAQQPMNSLSPVPAPVPVNPVPASSALSSTSATPQFAAFRRVTRIQRRTPYRCKFDPEKYTLLR